MNTRRTPNKLRLSLILGSTVGLVAAAGVSSAMTAPVNASQPAAVQAISAATPALTPRAESGDVYSKPRYLPFRAEALNGCVKTNCTANGKPDHGYWALDFFAPPGTPVYSAGGGIARLEKASGQCFGGTLWIDHGGGDTSRYVHLGDISVSDGQVVTPDTKIGTFSGGSCESGALHMTISQRGRKQVKLSSYPGELRACRSSSPITYPSVLGFGNWDDMPFKSQTMSSDGTSCWPAGTESGAPTDVGIKFRAKSMKVSWNPTETNPGAVESYRIGYRHFSERMNRWTKQQIVTAGSGARSAKIKAPIHRTRWEAVVWSYDSEGASVGTKKVVKLKVKPKR